MSATYEARIAVLEEALENLLDEWMEQSSDVEMEDEDGDEGTLATREEDRTRIEKEFIVTLTRLIEVIRDANVANDVGLPSIVAKVDGLLNKAALWANDEEEGPYGGSGSMPSFAHISDEGIAKDNSEEKKFCSRLPANLKELGFTPWKKTVRLHPLSTLCAHFKVSSPTWEVTDANERATTVFQARCEIDSGGIRKPIDLVLSSTGNVLALTSMGGWKNRTPYLWYYLPNHDNNSSYEFTTKRSIKADLTSNLDRIILDEERNLFFVADHKRIKSYRYKLPSGSDMPGKALRIHTMNSSDYTGPLALLQNGRFLRAGDGNIAVWELDGLQTHGETGKEVVGDKMDAASLDTWRDDPEYIERSTGSVKSTTIKLEGCKSDDDGPEIFTWHSHPSNANVMLCGMNLRLANNFCHAYDLQVEGRIASRYLGHGGAVEGFSTVASDPQVFMTRCGDGHVRLYDVRYPLPVMTIAASKYLEPVTAAVFAKPDGIPFAFTSNSKTEDIKLWDIRARSLVYDLATGNNTVEAMAWDDASNTLYAASYCPYVDWNGRHIDYRKAKIPVQAENPNTGEMDENEEQFEEESEDICWPKDAYHAEDYFGHAFDAGDHRIYKFSFKANPDSERLPYYGSARGGGLW